MSPDNSGQPDVATRYRVIMILWFAIIMSLMMLLVLVFVATVNPNGNRRLALILETVTVVPFGISFLVKQRILAKAITEQKVDFVQPGYVAAFALCEMAALLGVVDHFTTNSPYFYVGFLLAGLGLLLHFPQKKYLLQASGQEF